MIQLKPKPNIRRDYESVSVRVEIELVQAFERKLEQQGISKSEALRQLIQLYVESD